MRAHSFRGTLTLANDNLTTPRIVRVRSNVLVAELKTTSHVGRTLTPILRGRPCQCAEAGGSVPSVTIILKPRDTSAAELLELSLDAFEAFTFEHWPDLRELPDQRYADLVLKPAALDLSKNPARPLAQSSERRKQVSSSSAA